MEPSCAAVTLHALTPAQSPFKALAEVAFSEFDDEVRARAAVRDRVGDASLARAYTAYTEDFPKGSINDFNQLPVEKRREYFASTKPEAVNLRKLQQLAPGEYE